MPFALSLFPSTVFILKIKNLRNLSICFSFLMTRSTSLCFSIRVKQFQDKNGILSPFLCSFKFREHKCFLSIQNLLEMPPKTMPSTSSILKLALDWSFSYSSESTDTESSSEESSGFLASFFSWRFFSYNLHSSYFFKISWGSASKTY